MPKKKFLTLFLVIIIFTSSFPGITGSAETGKGDVCSNTLGVAALEAGKVRLAESYFRKAIKKNSKVKFYYNNLAAALIRQKKYKEAYPVLFKAIEIDPEYAKALSNLAITCFHLGEYQEAYRYYRMAKKADEEYAAKRFDKERVKKRIKEEKKKNPHNKTYDELLERLED